MTGDATTGDAMRDVGMGLRYTRWVGSLEHPPATSGEETP